MARQQRLGPIAIALAAGAILAAGIAVWFGWKADSPATLLRALPQDTALSQPEVAFAASLYRSKGNSYIWGDNDCSVFVADYLAAAKHPLTGRPTTVELMDKDFMAKHGLQPRQLTESAAGDVLVFRYRNLIGEARGHCGVVISHDKNLWVAHNTAKYDGLVYEPLTQFLDRAKQLTGSLSAVKAFTPGT